MSGKDEKKAAALSDLPEIKALSGFLLWKRCVFMTFEQYKKTREHINPRIYYHEAFTNDIKKHVIEHIKGLANNLPFKKVPHPIYVLVAKHREYDGKDSILPVNCKSSYSLDYDFLKKEYANNPNFNDYPYKNISVNCQKAYADLVENKFDYAKYRENPLSSNYTKYESYCFKDKSNNFMSASDEKIRSFKETYEKNKRLKELRDKNVDVSCLQNEKKEWISDEEAGKYKFIYDSVEKNNEELIKSSIATYRFNGLYEVIIYIPNLNKDLQYFTSFLDFSYQNRWMNLIVGRNSKHLTIIRLQKDYASEIIKSAGEENYVKQKGMYDTLIQGLNMQSRDEFPLIKDLTHICHNMGCSSAYGEDLEEMVPTVSKSYDDQVSNARAKGPYYPTKCLKTDYYDKHMMVLDAGYRTNVRKELLKNVDAFKANYEKIQKGETPSEQYSSTNIVDVIKGTAKRYRNDFHKEGTDPAQYSKEYNRKILAELAFRHNSYPGVQEITFPAFRLDDSYADLKEYTHYMPWGNILLKDEYVLNEGDVLQIEKVSFKSFNRVYEIRFDANGILSLFAGQKRLKAIVNGSFAKYNNKTLVFENGSLNIYGYDNGNNDNRHSLYVSNANAISPLSIIIENNGVINVYDNGFNEIGVIDTDVFVEKKRRGI